MNGNLKVLHDGGVMLKSWKLRGAYHMPSLALNFSNANDGMSSRLLFPFIELQQYGKAGVSADHVAEHVRSLGIPV